MNLNAAAARNEKTRPHIGCCSGIRDLQLRHYRSGSVASSRGRERDERALAGNHVDVNREAEGSGSSSLARALFPASSKKAKEGHLSSSSSSLCSGPATSPAETSSQFLKQHLQFKQRPSELKATVLQQQQQQNTRARGEGRILAKDR